MAQWSLSSESTVLPEGNSLVSLNQLSTNVTCPEQVYIKDIILALFIVWLLTEACGYG